ncbi:MAG TPA: type VI secretion system tip protein TssI/VgrG, partial [Thermoanaerobaculia bacterium]
MAYAQTARYISISTPLGTDKLHVRSLRGEERISGLFHFFLELQSEDNALDFSKIVGKAVTVSIVISSDTTRYINGIVGRFVQGGSDARFTTYFMDLHPWLWLMTMARDNRIYQNKSAKDIVTGLFTELGFTDYTDSTAGTYNALEYCVQYNETAFAFVSRLMESAGIFYFFTHADGKHTLTLGDDATAFADCAGAATVSYGTLGTDIVQTAVLACTVEELVIPGTFAADDFGFETPSTDLMGSTDSTVATNGSKRRIYEYPAGVATKDDADALSKLRLEELEAPRQVLRGESLAAGFVPGGKTTLQNHYRTDVNATYVLSRVSHSAVDDSYTNSFEAFPSANVYRPRRTTRKPVIAGTQTAIVVGKSGEEIYTDKYGRVKVQFHWDQLGKNDENSSCWIRVAQGWAGTSWGAFFLPRVGNEVVVSFLDGDPDRPLITGSVYNAEQTVPYTLPTDQTKSTIKSNTSKGGSGFNEIRFEDKKDSEEVFAQAQKDMNVVINNNETRKVGFTKKSNGDQT